MNKLSILYSYYENPDLLNKQIQIWKSYSDEIKEFIDIYIVDDCSVKNPLKIINIKKLNIYNYRIQEKKQWNWPACRNIAAKESTKEWLLITDIDMFITNNELTKLLVTLKNLNKNIIYKFNRRNYIDDVKMHQHGTTFLITKKLFWSIGGYDERLSGLYYGITGEFNRRLKKRIIETLNITMMWIPNKGSITNENRVDHIKELEKRKRTGTHKVLSFKYEKTA